MDNPPDDGPCEVTITAPNYEWLHAFVRRLVKDRLAAAAHVDTMRTTYWWANEIHDADEARATLHTRMSLVDRIASTVKESHPYDVACVAAKAIDAGENDYISWLLKETRSS